MAKRAQDGPKIAQDGPKRAPRKTKALDSNSNLFFFVQFLTIVGPFFALIETTSAGLRDNNFLSTNSASRPADGHRQSHHHLDSDNYLAPFGTNVHVFWFADQA